MDHHQNPSGISGEGTGTANRNSHMRTVRTVAELRRAVADARARGDSIGLVPTMGSLHEGHLSLVRRAAADCGFVVVSLFVNPSQFGPGEDYERYPRDEERDAALARRRRRRPALRAHRSRGLSRRLRHDGRGGRPHRRAVRRARAAAARRTSTGSRRSSRSCSTCARPDVAYFGQKDYQQSLVIRRRRARPRHAGADRGLPDGARRRRPRAQLPQRLPLRVRARARPRASTARCARPSASPRTARGRDDVLRAARAELDAAGVEPEYLEVLRADDLSAPAWQPGEQVVLAIAAQVGPARLIDNTLIELPVRNPEPAVAG